MATSCEWRDAEAENWISSGGKGRTGQIVTSHVFFTLKDDKRVPAMGLLLSLRVEVVVCVNDEFDLMSGSYYRTQCNSVRTETYPFDRPEATEFLFEVMLVGFIAETCYDERSKRIAADVGVLLRFVCRNELSASV